MTLLIVLPSRLEMSPHQRATVRLLEVTATLGELEHSAKTIPDIPVSGNTRQRIPGTESFTLFRHVEEHLMRVPRLASDLSDRLHDFKINKSVVPVAASLPWNRCLYFAPRHMPPSPL